MERIVRERKEESEGWRKRDRERRRREMLGWGECEVSLNKGRRVSPQKT